MVRVLLLSAPLWALLSASAAPPPDLQLQLEGLRSSKGTLRICLTRQADRFPDCKPGDGVWRINADPSARITVPALPAGAYGIAILHDENANGRMDTMLGMPREGFGFSRNPRITFGPPPFDAVRFSHGSADGAQHIRIRYML